MSSRLRAHFPQAHLLESPHTLLVMLTSMKSFYGTISWRKPDIQSNILTRASLAEEWGTLNNLLTHCGEQRVKHEETMSGKNGARVLANLEWVRYHCVPAAIDWSFPLYSASRCLMRTRNPLRLWHQDKYLPRTSVSSSTKKFFEYSAGQTPNPNCKWDYNDLDGNLGFYASLGFAQDFVT